MGRMLALVVLLAQEVPLTAPLPAGADPSKPWRLVRESDGRPVPCQIRAGSIFWVEGEGPRAYRLEPGGPADGARVEAKVEEGKQITLRAAGKDAVRYAMAAPAAPAGVDPAHERSAYLHPIWTPDGRVISNDFPPKHGHHHGIWFSWRTGEFEGRKLNAFAPLEKLGRQEHAELLEAFSGAVFGGFRARQRLVDLNAPGGPKAALEDLWEVRVWALPGLFVVDLESTQTCASDSPFVNQKNYYGGLGFRGSAEWEGKEGVAFRTSEGKTRLDGNGTVARWVAMSGKIGGKAAGFGLLGHPSNFRAPQPTRLHPSEPFFCWVPGAQAEHRIEPGKPYVSRYRFLSADRALDDAEMERHWAAYAEPGRGVAVSVR
jgi:hypothetical protein